MSSLAHEVVQPRNAVRPCARSQASVVLTCAQSAHPEPWGNGSTRWGDFPQEAPSKANAPCRAGKHQNNDTHRAWWPESLVVLVLLRQTGRTVTLTRPAVHTKGNSSSDRQDRKGTAGDGKKKRIKIEGNDADRAIRDRSRDWRNSASGPAVDTLREITR